MEAEMNKERIDDLARKIVLIFANSYRVASCNRERKSTDYECAKLIKNILKEGNGKNGKGVEEYLALYEQEKMKPAILSVEQLLEGNIGALS